MKIKVFLSNLLIFISKITTVVNHIGEVMVSIFALSVIDCEIELQSYQIKDFKIGICCFSTKQVVLRRKSKDWLAQNQDNVFK
jgi:hypothetical protein